MILIADSGSTKTDWCVVERGQLVRQIFTKGMNPFFQSEEEMSDEIVHALLPHLESNTFEEIHFYGAGCVPEKIPLVYTVLASHFKANGIIDVNTDMLGAARGLCGHNPGIVCIMGTGSNSCYYDGVAIVSNVSPLGFILGDEGSGAVLGKLLIGDILKNQTRPELKEKFLTQFGLTQAEIIERVYRMPFPNRFLASISPFLAQNIHEPEIHALVLNAFKAFFTRNVMQYDYERNSVHLIGSVAFYYKEILVEAALQTGIRMGTIIQSPMEGLISYHGGSEHPNGFNRTTIFRYS